MPKRALIEHRPWLLASIAAAVAFYFLRDSEVLAGVQTMLLKGAGVALLAAYAWRRGKGTDALLLTTYLAFGAIGDMLIELSVLYGGIAFFAGHIAAIALFLRNRREDPSGSQKAFAAVLLVSTPVICWLLSGSFQIGLYGIGLGAMAATAWLSRFSRYRVGIGAVLFVISDFLIFSEMGPLDLGRIPALLIWPLYYLGQLMIATGVVQRLRKDRKIEAKQQ